MRSREISANSSFAEQKQNCRPQASLPNLLKKSSSVGRDFFYQVRPTNQTLQLRDKSDFIPKSTAIANVFKPNLFNNYSLSLQSIGVSVQIQTLGHVFPKLKSSMPGQNQATQVNFIPL
jgi:hypothetical protein